MHTIALIASILSVVLILVICCIKYKDKCKKGKNKRKKNKKKTGKESKRLTAEDSDEDV